MAYIPPGEVISPKAHWHLFDVVLDTGEVGAPMPSGLGTGSAVSAFAGMAVRLWDA